MKLIKSVLALLMAALMLLALAACGGEAQPTESTAPTETDESAKSGKPVITAQPEDQTASGDELAKFTVEATGDGLTYQWYWRSSPDKDWKASTLDTANKPTLKVKPTPERDGYQYRCEVSNDAGQVYSDFATLTVG